jgi:hypothetical protein
VLVRGFRRFVTHDPKGKVLENRRQPEAGVFLLRQLLPGHPGRKSQTSFADHD